MNVLYNHITTLCSLWSSLDVDSSTINKKLETVIAELEKLIVNEAKEKVLLSATIEDAMTNIEYASHILGVSLENVLYSSIDNERIIISPETISIYNALNPTWPKQKALMELDSRLTEEISIRQQHMNDWLSSIHQLCKTLQEPFKFNSIQDNDLSWATLQSVSCELRDLKQLYVIRIEEMNRLLKSIHYYWHTLRYNGNKEDMIESSLSSLFENFPLDIDDLTQYITQDYEYYQHPTNQLQLTETTLQLLKQKLHTLKEIYQTRFHTFTYSTAKMKAIWEEFNIPILERPTLPTLLGDNDMLILKDMIDNIDPLVKSVFDKYIQQFKADLIPLWDACLLSEPERKEFIDSLYDLNTKLEIKSKVDHHMTYLRSLYKEGQALQALMKERKDLIQKMIDFEKTASDPKRLFQASFQLLEEERWRNSCLPRLLQLDHQLIKAIDEFEKLAGKPVMIGNRRYMDTLLDEIADREANQTFFGFLNSDPVSSSTTTKRKSRPASVSSLGSITTSTSKKPPHQLKTRAVSAIISPTLDQLPKKIKPSQSMPLNKRQQLKKMSSNLRQQQSPQEIYSSSAYINSNINLTKAFKQKRSHMASLIPIATSKPITATKSV